LSIVGMKAIELIQNYNPTIYLEIQCNHPETEGQTHSNDQNDLLGVPELVNRKRCFRSATHLP